MPILTTLGAACAKAWGFTSGLITDQYFNLVSLLLPGNGTNGAQNNTFLDGSSNTFTITRNGNTTQGTFSPFSQTGWGAYFDGSNDSITSATSSALNLSSGNWTIQGWIYPTAYSAGNNVPIYLGVSGADKIVVATIGTAGDLYYLLNGSVVITSTTAAPLNSWSYVALVKNGSTTTLYLNGVSLGTTTSVPTSSNKSFVLGTDPGSPAPYSGYMSNFRVLNGTADTAVPTSPFTAITNTSLLICQSNRFVDNSASPITLTPNNGVAITPFSPFAPTQSYSAAAVGGSGYFDGTGDYLTVPDNTAFDLPGDFTIECWLYRTANTANTILYTLGSYASGQNGFTLYVETTNNLRCYGNGGLIFSGTNGLVPLNAWTHIALIRSGTGADNMKCYINGVFDTAAKASNNTSWTGVAANGFSPGSFYDGSYGSQTDKTYMAGLRFIKGQALASGDFTPPSAPLTTSAVGWTGANAAGSLTGTVSLLLNFTNAGVVDATAKNVLETVGNAQISTSVSKFGSGSIAFDGNGDRATMPGSALLALGSGDFTVEAWVYKSANTAYMTLCGNLAVAGENVWQILADVTGNKICWYNGVSSSFIITSSTTLNTGAWYYIAFVRSGSASNNFKLYINGSLDTQATMTTNYDNTSRPFFLGQSPELSAGRDWNGYVDDFRITKGYARTITASPTAPFPVQ